MTPPIIPNRPFDLPAAWTTADIGGKDALAFDLDDRHLAAFEAAVAGLRERGLTAFEDVGRDDFPLDAIAEDVRAWRHEVADGRGLLLLREFPVDRWSQEEAELVWFGLGAHFGRAVSQSALGDLLGHVVDVGGDDMRHRAYRNARELRMHTDRCDTIGMFCLRRAKSGGESGYASALAVHDRIREIKPELLESLWTGFHLHRFGEQPPGEPPYTPIRIPVFSECDGVTTVILIGGYAWMAADEFDAPFSDRDRETLTTFERLAADPEFRIGFHLERGEALLFNNCAVLHDRTAFEDHDEPHLKRHLMRLWLMDWDGRPTVEGVRYHKGEGGITPQKGKQPYYAHRNPATSSVSSGGGSGKASSSQAGTATLPLIRRDT